MNRTSWRDLLSPPGGSPVSTLDRRRILETVSGLNPGRWPVAPDEVAPPEVVSRFAALVERRATGEPLQYLVGSWGFRHLELMLDRRVLIPRPETEQVVDVALGEVDHWREERSGAGGEVVVADLGTGSGAIALSMVNERAGLCAWATDASGSALSVAGANLARLGSSAAARLHLARGRWFEALPPSLQGSLALVVSNPPYVSEAELAELPAEVAGWEPRDALVAGPTGLEALEVLIAGAPPWLAPGGSLVLEIAPHQAAHVADLAGEAGLSAVEVRRDLAGRQRVLVGRLGT